MSIVKNACYWPRRVFCQFFSPDALLFRVAGRPWLAASMYPRPAPLLCSSFNDILSPHRDVMLSQLPLVPSRLRKDVERVLERTLVPAAWKL